MASHEAKVAAYENTRERYERRARDALEDLRSDLANAQRRLDTPRDALTRQLMPSTASALARHAQIFAEATAALVALDEVSYFTDNPEGGE